MMPRHWFMITGVVIAGISVLGRVHGFAEDGVPKGADTPGVAALPMGMSAKISLDLRNTDVVDALKFIAMKSGVSIITTKAVTGRVSLLINEAPIQDVFDIMLRSNNLAYDSKGGLYNVMTQEEYRTLYGKNFADVRSVKVFYLKYMVPDQAFALLDMLKSEIGRVMVDPESGNVLVMDSPGRIEMMEKALADFEEKNTIRVIKLQYAKAKDIEEALKNQLDSKKVGSIKADERGNQVVVQTLPERMDQIERMVKTLDQKTKEILIDVSIIKIKISDELETGVNWEGLFDTGAKYGLSYLGSTPFSSVQSSTDTWRSRLDTYNAVGSVGSYPFSGTTSNYSSSSRRTGLEELHFGMVTQNRDFDVALKFLATVGKTKILSNPKLAVINNQEAKIHVGQKEAYVTTTTTTGQTTNTVAEQVTFVDVGVLLSVVPIINDDGFVNLKVKAEISSVIDTLVTPTENRIPIIDTSLAETTVLVKDGSTVVIGGLRKDTKVDSSEQIPFFGSIPFLGRFFGNKSNATERSELLIMLTPKMISGEVLVSESGAKSTVGGVAMKPMKDYSSVPVEPLEAGVESERIFIPPEGGRLEIKGLRK